MSKFIEITNDNDYEILINLNDINKLGANFYGRFRVNKR